MPNCHTRAHTHTHTHTHTHKLHTNTHTHRGKKSTHSQLLPHEAVPSNSSLPSQQSVIKKQSVILYKYNPLLSEIVQFKLKTCLGADREKHEHCIYTSNCQTTHVYTNYTKTGGTFYKLKTKWQLSTILLVLLFPLTLISYFISRRKSPPLLLHPLPPPALIASFDKINIWNNCIPNVSKKYLPS